MKTSSQQARRAHGQSVRRWVAIAGIVVLGSAVAFVGPAGAAVGDAILGGAPTASLASTVCPAGSAVIAASGEHDVSYVDSVTVQCSGGAAASGSIGGGVSDSTGSTTCTGLFAGAVAVGIEGYENADGIAALGLRCAETAKGIPDPLTTITASYYGGLAGVILSSKDGPYDCPDGEVLTGLTGSVRSSGGGFVVQDVEIQCAAPAGALPTIVISGTAPDGQVTVPYDFAYTASGDTGITFSVHAGSLPPGLSLDAATGALTGTPASSGSYSFTVRATGDSGAYADLDDAIDIVPPPAPPSPAAVGLAPASVGFGNQTVGTTSSAQTVTITNTAAAGSDSLVVGQLSLTGANTGDFSLSNNNCSNPVAPGSHCTVDVSFAPTAVGSRGASLSIPSNAGSSPDAVALSGTGTPPGADVRLSVSGPTTAASGSQNTYVVTVSNLGPATATGVVMTVQVPSGTKFVGVTTTQGSCTHPASGATSGTISCSLGNLASGAAAADSVTLKLSLSGKGGTIALVALASASTPDPDLSNNVASLATTVKKK
jgi:uncharacterized repeat protein (TIGR01451 family)